MLITSFSHGDILMLFSEGHILIIGLIALLLFGGKKIPELMKGLGGGIREFNDAKNNVKREIQDGMKDNKPEITNNAPASTAVNNNQQPNA